MLSDPESVQTCPSFQVLFNFTIRLLATKRGWVDWSPFKLLSYLLDRCIIECFRQICSTILPPSWVHCRWLLVISAKSSHQLEIVSLPRTFLSAKYYVKLVWETIGFTLVQNAAWSTDKSMSAGHPHRQNAQPATLSWARHCVLVGQFDPLCSYQVLWVPGLISWAPVSCKKVRILWHRALKSSYSRQTCVCSSDAKEGRCHEIVPPTKYQSHCWALQWGTIRLMAFHFCRYMMALGNKFEVARRSRTSVDAAASKSAWWKVSVPHWSISRNISYLNL